MTLRKRIHFYYYDTVSGAGIQKITGCPRSVLGDSLLEPRHDNLLETYFVIHRSVGFNQKRGYAYENQGAAG